LIRWNWITRKKIVFDLVEKKASYSYKELTQIAGFDAETGRYFKASRMYGDVSRQYPDNTDVYYLWGKVLLLQRNFDKAKEKFALVPESSANYKDSQDRIAQIDAPCR